MKKLNILIPQYNEYESDISPLLDSIAIQQNIDFDEIGVIICNDGSECILSDNFLESYPFEIRFLGAAFIRNTSFSPSMLSLKNPAALPYKSNTMFLYIISPEHYQNCNNQYHN